MTAQTSLDGPGRSEPASGQQSLVPASWRNWLLSGVVRAVVASGYLLTPTVRVQLGDAANAALSCFLGLVVIVALIGHWYVRRGEARRDLAADVVSIVALTPSVIVAAGIQNADDRFGGRTANVLAALSASVALFAVVAIVARLDERIDFGSAAIGALPGALIVVSLLGDPHLYDAGAAWQGISIAWMVAAIATVVFGFLPVGARNFVPIVVFAAFGLWVILSGAGDATSGEGSGTLSVIVVIVTGAIMVLIAPANQRR